MPVSRSSSFRCNYAQKAPFRTLFCSDTPARRRRGRRGRGIDVDDVSYFLSRITIEPTDAPGLARWRKRLFVALSRNAASPATYFGLPEDRVIALGSRVDL